MKNFGLPSCCVHIVVGIVLLLYFILIGRKSYLKWTRLVQRIPRRGNFMKIAMYHARKFMEIHVLKVRVKVK